MRFSAAIIAFLVLATALLIAPPAGPDPAAAAGPFGVATPDARGPAFGGPLGGVFAWIAARQAEFYRTLTGALGNLKESGQAAWLLAGISFLYGVFHAAGPGHGKAVITSYLLVSHETVRRGIAIAFAAAFLQGATAVAIVLVAALILKATAIGMSRATDWFEIASYALIAGVGAWLLWVKLAAREHARLCHAHAAGAGHAHAPEPMLVSRPLTFSRAWSAIVAVGVRPCSGAIIVLVFALSQKLLPAGIGSVAMMSLGTAITVSALVVLAVSAKDLALRYANADSPITARTVRALEIAGAAFVLIFGLMLLGGAVAGRAG